MEPHHRAAIDRLTDHFKDDPAFPALIVGGSLVRGWGRTDSDVDVMLVATDAEYAQRAADNRLTYFTTEFCDYPGGYVDGKIITLDFLHEVAARGSEPARAAFMGCFTAYSHWPEVDELIAAIPVYPVAEQRDRLESFFAQVEAWHWYVGEAEKRGDRYLLLRTASELALFGARLILAHNCMLYPYHKWLTTALRAAPLRPAGLLEHMERLLAEPSKAHADAFRACLEDFADWPRPPEGWGARFMRDTELMWRSALPPVGDW